GCKQFKHIKVFPLVFPDDPNDYRRVSLCQPCVRAAKKIMRTNPKYQLFIQERRKDEQYPRNTARNSLRRSVELQAVPNWVNLDKIQDIYQRARDLTKATGIKHHVDHIVPLVNPMVCGLHIHQNLQVLTAAANCRKSNRLL